MNVRTAAARILSANRTQTFDYETDVSKSAAQLQLTGRDRDFLYILVKGVIVYRRYLDFAIELAAHRPLKKFEKTILNLLRIGAFQSLILETPAHAFTHETVEAARQLKKAWATGLINAVLRHLPDSAELGKKLSTYPQNEALAIEMSHPQWMVDRWIERFGYAETRKIAAFNNRYQKIYFRHNPIKIQWPDLENDLLKNGFQPHIENARPAVFFSVETPGGLLRSDLFRDGFMSVQDLSQAQAALLLNPRKGETIIDACAAPGGKTGLMAQIAGPEAKIFAYDVSGTKVDLMQNEGFRLGLDFVNYGVADARTGTFGMAEKILLDVPCTGSGVMARRADLRWNRTARQLHDLIRLQREILSNMQKYLKPGGRLVYSTCSIEQEENWGNIEWFLASNPEFSVEDAREFVDKKWCDNQGAVQILPQFQNETGGFAVRLHKR